MGAALPATHNTLELWIERLRDEAQAGFPEKVTPFERIWRCMDAMVSLVPGAANRSSEFATQTTKPTTVRGARRAVGFWQIAAFRGS